MTSRTRDDARLRARQREKRAILRKARRAGVRSLDLSDGKDKWQDEDR